MWGSVKTTRYQFNCSQLSVVCISRKEFKINNELVCSIGLFLSNQLHPISPVWLSRVGGRRGQRGGALHCFFPQVQRDILWPGGLPVYVRLCWWGTLSDLLWRRYILIWYCWLVFRDYSGTLWDEDLEVCNYDDSVDCGDRPRPDGPTKPTTSTSTPTEKTTPPASTTTDKTTMTTAGTDGVI